MRYMGPTKPGRQISMKNRLGGIHVPLPFHALRPPWLSWRLWARPSGACTVRSWFGNYDSYLELFSLFRSLAPHPAYQLSSVPLQYGVSSASRLHHLAQ